MTIGACGFAANAFTTQAWMVYVVLSLSALQGLVFPSMNATMSHIVDANQQGELQGGIASLGSMAAIVGPPLLTGTLAHFTRDPAQLYFPGAAFLVSAGLALTALTIVVVFARGMFPRR